MHLVSATMVLGALTRWLRAARFPDHVRPSWGIEGQGGERKPGTVNLFCQKYWISGLYFSQPPSSAVPAELLKIEVRFSATSDLPSFVFNSTVTFHKNSWSSRLWFSLPWSSAVPAEQLKFEVPILPTPNFSRFEVWLASCSDRTTENGDSGIPGMTSFFFQHCSSRTAEVEVPIWATRNGSRSEIWMKSAVRTEQGKFLVRAFLGWDLFFNTLFQWNNVSWSHRFVSKEPILLIP